MSAWNSAKIAPRYERKCVGCRLDNDKPPPPLCAFSSLVFLRFCRSFLPSRYQLHDTGFAAAAFPWPSSRIPQRVLFVSSKLIHCHSTPPCPSPPLNPPFAIQRRSWVGLNFCRRSSAPSPPHARIVSLLQRRPNPPLEEQLKVQL